MTTKSLYPMFMLAIFLIVLFFAKQNSIKIREQNKIRNEKLNHDRRVEQEKLTKMKFEQNLHRKLQIYRRMMFDYSSRTYALQIFSIRFNTDDIDLHSNNFNNHHRNQLTRKMLKQTNDNDKNDKNYDDGVNINNENQNLPCEKITRHRDKAATAAAATTAGKQENGNHIPATTTINTKPIDNIHGSNSIVYIVVIFLIISLVRAALDMSNQMKKKKERDQDEFSRRCSLQEFAQSRHKNMKKKRPSRQSSVNTPGTPTLPSIGDEAKNNKFFSFSRFFVGNRKMFESSPSFFTTKTNQPSSTGAVVNQCSITNIVQHTPLPAPQINSTPVLVETGSPAKTGEKLLVGGRPVPLTRRSSFPALMGQHFMPPTHARRPSMDSLSEGDSSPDVKRRVRMIHRH